MVELLIGIGIVAVLMGVALPSYQTFVKNNCLTTTSVTLVGTLQLARSEAVKRRTNVTVAAKSDSTDWASGWTVTWDEDLDGDNTLDTGEDFDGSGGLNTITMSDITLSCNTNGTLTATDKEIVYLPTGFPQSGVETFTLCDERDNTKSSSPGREVKISATGRPRTNAKYKDAAGCPN